MAQTVAGHHLDQPRSLSAWKHLHTPPPRQPRLEVETFHRDDTNGHSPRRHERGRCHHSGSIVTSGRSEQQTTDSFLLIDQQTNTAVAAATARTPRTPIGAARQSDTGHRIAREAG